MKVRPLAFADVTADVEFGPSAQFASAVPGPAAPAMVTGAWQCVPTKTTTVSVGGCGPAFSGGP